MTRAEADPPYFSITPDSARADLGPPVGTAGFAEVARKAAQGRADLVGRGLNPEGRKTLRLFSTWEITRYLIPVAPPHFRRVLRANPELPQGRTEKPGGAQGGVLWPPSPPAQTPVERSPTCPGSPRRGRLLGRSGVANLGSIVFGPYPA